MFGGAAPLPIRLTANQQEGWPPEQMLRMAADVATAKRLAPFAIITVEREAGGVPAITRILSQKTIPGLTVSGSANLILTFPTQIDDERLVLTKAKFSVSSSNPQLRRGVGWEIVGSELRLLVNWTTGPGDIKATISVFVETTAFPEDYGGYPNKRASDEEQIPHALVFYQELDASLGSAYSGKTSGSVHARKIALARALQCALRGEEKVRNQSTPTTASDRLPNWAQLLELPTLDGEREWMTRRRASAFYAARSGHSVVELEKAIRGLIGGYLDSVRILEEDGEWDQSEWPVSWDLGGGVWASSNSRVVVNVFESVSPTDQHWERLIKTDLFALLDRLLHSGATFGWAVRSSAGFQINVSRLGVDTL